MATGLQIKVGADTTEFRQEIRELPREFEKAEEEISKSADRVGGAISGALKGLISAGAVIALERVINHFDKVADAASKYGATAEDIQRVGTAAEMTGGNVDAVAQAMERAGVAAAKAARGNEEFVEKFNRAGIDAVAFSTATLTERVKMVAAAQQEAGVSGDQHAAILEAVGDGAASIDFQRIADEMGNVIVASNKTVEQLSRANDLMNQAKQTAMAFGAEGIGLLADQFERAGSILGEGDSGLLGKLAKWIRFSSQFSPAAGAFHMLGLGGETIQEMEDAEKRLNAIALLRSRDGVDNATEEQIKAEMRAIEEREKAANRANTDTNRLLDEGKAKTEQRTQVKQRLLEISLELKEAEAAQNTEMAKQLRYQEDLYKGLLKYKEAEDAYGMAVREANAELAKRNEQLKFADKGDGTFQESITIQKDTLAALQPKLDALNAFYNESKTLIQKQFSGVEQSNQMLDLDNLFRRVKADTLQGGKMLQILSAQIPMIAEAARTEPERQRAQAETTDRLEAAPSKPQDLASETTLQKAVAFLEELTGKLPQPVLA